MKLESTLLLLILLASPSVWYVVSSKALFTQPAYGGIEAVKSVLGVTKEPAALSKIAFVGDVLLARDVENNMNKFGSDYPFSIFYELPLYEAVIANFESSVPLIHQPTPSMQTRFSTKPEVLSELFSHGITHVSLANNHSYDFGKVGYKNTQQELFKNYLTPFGNPNEIGTSSVAFLQTGSSTIAVVAVSLVNVTPKNVDLKHFISYAKNNSDYTIVYVHWGTEYNSSHDRAQQLLGRSFVTYGADAVIGHHPHVVQDVEMFNGRPIFYSLGNFIFDQYFSDNVQQGLLLELVLEDNYVVYKLKPVTSIGSRNQPRLMGAVERTIFLDALAKRSTGWIADQIRAGEIRIVK